MILLEEIDTFVQEKVTFADEQVTISSCSNPSEIGYGVRSRHRVPDTEGCRTQGGGEMSQAGHCEKGVSLTAKAGRELHRRIFLIAEAGGRISKIQSRKGFGAMT